MKVIVLITLLLITSLSFSQADNWVKTEGEVVEITQHSGKRLRSSAVIKFNLENGEEQMGATELFRIPFIGGLKPAGDKITIYYKRNNPVLVKTTIGKFISSYGMLTLIVLGIIFSIKPFLKKRKLLNARHINY